MSVYHVSALNLTLGGCSRDAEAMKEGCSINPEAMEEGCARTSGAVNGGFSRNNETIGYELTSSSFLFTGDSCGEAGRGLLWVWTRWRQREELVLMMAQWRRQQKELVWPT